MKGKKTHHLTRGLHQGDNAGRNFTKLLEQLPVPEERHTRGLFAPQLFAANLKAVVEVPASPAGQLSFRS